MNQVTASAKLFDRPIVILGAPRSGTTFLGDVLATHREFAHAIEPSPIWRYGNESKSDTLRPEHLSERIRGHIRSHFHRFLAENGKSRLLEKTPQNSLRPAFVDAALPEARYLHIIRHGYEASLSIRSHWETNTKGFRGVRGAQRLKELSPLQIPRYGMQFAMRTFGSITGKGRVLWGPRLPGLRSLVKELGTLEVAALQWRWCVERTCAFGRALPENRYIEFKLEELDDESFRRITRFCEMGDDTEVREVFHKTFRPQTTNYRAGKAAESDLRILRASLEPTLKWLDYSL